MTVYTPGQTLRYYDLGNPFKENMDYTNGAYIVFHAKAKPGVANAALNWSICKFLYDANWNVTNKVWANADNSFSYSWDLRGTYTYS